MNIVQSIKNLFSQKPKVSKPYSTDWDARLRETRERFGQLDNMMTTTRRVVAAMQREDERERARRRYENAYLTPSQPITTTIDDIWTASTGTGQTYPESIGWRMGPTVNPFTSDWIGSPFVAKEPIPEYQILTNNAWDDPLNQRVRIAIEGVGTFAVSTEELINSNIEDLVRGLVKMGPKKAVHIVVIGVISV